MMMLRGRLPREQEMPRCVLIHNFTQLHLNSNVSAL